MHRQSNPPVLPSLALYVHTDHSEVEPWWSTRVNFEQPVQYDLCHLFEA